MSTAAIHFDSPRVRPARSEALGSVRLTRRGRLVVFAAVLAIAFAVFTLFGSPAVSTGEAHHAVAQQVVVEPGQTLWDIAGDVAPGEDVRTVMAEIVDLNALSSAGDIRAGMTLDIPDFD